MTGADRFFVAIIRVCFVSFCLRVVFALVNDAILVSSVCLYDMSCDKTVLLVRTERELSSFQRVFAESPPLSYQLLALSSFKSGGEIFPASSCGLPLLRELFHRLRAYANHLRTTSDGNFTRSRNALLGSHHTWNNDR